MSIHRFVSARDTILIIVASLILIGSLVGQPLLFAFVETGSMQPTLDPGDGFIAVPSALSGPIEQGDVIVFRAEELHGGGLTTHRVVGSSSRGFITKGDANPFTDQAMVEPPVKRPQIVAKALSFGGRVVVVPYLGTAVQKFESAQWRVASTLGIPSLGGVHGLTYLFFVLSLLWYGAGEWRDTQTRDKQRVTSHESGTDTRLIVGLFVAVLVLGGTATMVIPAGSQQYGIISAEFESNQPTVIPMGESKDVTYTVGNAGVVPVVAYLEPASEGIDVAPHEMYVGGRTTANATVTLHAPSQTGYYRRYLTEHRYLAILPAPVIHSLYTIHPWLPIVVIDALVGIPFYLFGIALLGTGRIRERSKNRILPLTARIRRLF